MYDCEILICISVWGLITFSLFLCIFHIGQSNIFPQAMDDGCVYPSIYFSKCLLDTIFRVLFSEIEYRVTEEVSQMAQLWKLGSYFCEVYLQEPQQVLSVKNMRTGRRRGYHLTHTEHSSLCNKTCPQTISPYSNLGGFHWSLNYPEK